MKRSVSLRAGRRLVEVVFALSLILSLGLAGCGTGPTPSRTPFLSPTPTITGTPTPAPTGTPTRTPTASPTATFTPSPTLPPVTVGTPLPGTREPIIEVNLPQVSELGRWGRGRVNGLAWSPDGAQIAVASSLGVFLYDAETLTLQRFLDLGSGLQDGQINPPATAAMQLLYSPDGSTLAVAAAAVYAEGKVVASGVQLWDPASGQRLRVLDTPALVLTMTFSGDTLGILTRLERGQQQGARVGFWDYQTGAERSAVELIGGELAVAAALSPDLNTAATHGQDGPVRIWSLPNGAALATTQEVGDRAGPMAFSPDGVRLAVAYPDTTFDFINENVVRLWQVPAGQPEVARQLFSLGDATRAEGAQQAIVSLAWARDGARLAAGYEDRTVHVWRAAPGEAYRRMQGETLPLGLAFSPDGERVAAGGLEIFRLADAVKLAYTDDFIPGLFDLKISPAGGLVALAEYSQIELRSIEDGTVVRTITGMDGPVNAIDFSPDGTLLVAACQDSTTRLFNVADGRYLAMLGEAGDPKLSVAFSPNGRWIAVGGEAMLVRVYRVLDGELMLGLLEPYVSYELLFSPNVDQLASLTTNGVKIREFGGEIQRIQSSLEGWVGGIALSDMAYSPGSEWLALVGNDIIRVVDPLTRDDLYIISDKDGALPFSVTFSPDNAFLVSGWSDGQVRVYWGADGTPMAAWQAHPQAISRVAFTPNSRLMLTMGEEGTIRLWGVEVR